MTHRSSTGERPARRAVATTAAILGLASLLALACGGDDGLQRFELVGTVVSADPESRQLTIAHDEIPGFMAAMTMPFEADADWVYEVARGGERITATLVYDGTRAWLEEIVLTGSPDATPVDAEEELVAGAVPGAAIPLIELVDQDGDTVDFTDFHDGYLLVTFIYTRCPLPNFCPLMSSHFAAIHGAVGARREEYPELHLLSISIDPDNDTPAVLREYGRRYVGDATGAFERWSFATAAMLDLRDLAEFVGLKYTPDQGLVLHNLRTLLLDPEGRVHNLWIGNTWEPAEVLDELRSLAAGG